MGGASSQVEVPWGSNDLSQRRKDLWLTSKVGKLFLEMEKIEKEGQRNLLAKYNSDCSGFFFHSPNFQSAVYLLRKPYLPAGHSHCESVGLST